ncbi:MAG: DUF2336 domain-containing protein [Candidatus Liberibacter ctenarytainae]|uniref:DUF2336 domain-containing protein n=1 Tax=Candidatus Liberibacter ctenarytainae TaxID=2020335 RepID=A0A937AES5_9HYPH|nr:DUF2336 domain-containing protein [Candidatus Liberibacter ctenarytainae]
MSVKSFIKWAKGAKTQERVCVARVLGKTWCIGEFLEKERDSLVWAMTHLLDDPVLSVRLSFARGIALSNTVPRHVVLALSEDHPDVSGTMILHSPVLNDNDLIDLIQRGSNLTRVFVASRYKLSSIVAEYLIKEFGRSDNIIVLLENKSALLSDSLLIHIVEYFGHISYVRHLLFLRTNLSLKVRYLLMKHCCNAVCNSEIVRKVMASHRAKILFEESMRIGIFEMIQNIGSTQNLYELVEILQEDKQLTPALLIHALIIGNIDCVSVILETISEHSRNRISSILSTGSCHVVRALYESVGLDYDVSIIFVEATMIWRKIAMNSTMTEPGMIAENLLKIVRNKDIMGAPVKELLEMIERIYLDTNRKFLRSIASNSSHLVAA